MRYWSLRPRPVFWSLTPFRPRILPRLQPIQVVGVGSLRRA